MNPEYSQYIDQKGTADHPTEEERLDFIMEFLPEIRDMGDKEFFSISNHEEVDNKRD